MLILFDTRQRHFQQNPYIWQLQKASDAGVDIRGFTWGRAIFGRYDIFHLHWPEYLLWKPTSRAQSLLLFGLTLLLLCRWRVFGQTVVYTCHNEQPHTTLDSRRQALRQRLIDSARVVIVLVENQASEPKAVYIPHPDYTLRIATLGLDARQVERNSNSFIIAGSLLRYKNVTGGICSFRGIRDRSARLQVAGSCADPAYMEEIISAAGDDGRITLSFGWLEEGALAEKLAASHFTLLPYLEPGNSGVALLALSLGSVVVAIRSPAMSALEADYGPGRVRLFDAIDNHSLSSLILPGVDLDQTLVEFATPPGRAILDCTGAHAKLYRALMRAPSPH